MLITWKKHSAYRSTHQYQAVSGSRASDALMWRSVGSVALGPPSTFALRGPIQVERRRAKLVNWSIPTLATLGTLQPRTGAAELQKTRPRQHQWRRRLVQTGKTPVIFDSGTGTDTPLVAFGVFDAGTGTETISASVFLTGIPDSGHGNDTVSAAPSSLSVSDLGSGFDVRAVDAGTVTFGIPLPWRMLSHRPKLYHWYAASPNLPKVADAGAGTDTLQPISVSVNLGIDFATGSDSATAIQQGLFFVQDTGSAVDQALLSNITVPIIDSASVNEAWSFEANLSVLDASASASDIVTVTPSTYKDVADSAFGYDQVIQQVDPIILRLPWRIYSSRPKIFTWFLHFPGSIKVSDAVGGTDSVLPITIDTALADVGAGLDSATVVQQSLLNIPESAFGTDSISVPVVAVPIIDSASVNEVLGVVVAGALADDSGSGSDIVQMVENALVNAVDAMLGTDSVVPISLQINLVDALTSVDQIDLPTKEVLVSDSGVSGEGIQVELPIPVAPIVKVTFLLQKRSVKFTLH